MVLAENQKLKIASSTENMILVEKLINDVCDLFNINEDSYGNILVAVTEAVINAIVHGNKSNADKSVEITFKSTPSTIAFTIKDEGPGFDFNHLPDPTDPENIEKPNGRGVFLMRNLADQVSFDDHGKVVTLSFNINKAA